MEPVKGGILADPIPAVREILDRADSGASYASWALRFAAGLDGILAMLSGMSDTYFRRLFVQEFGVTPQQYISRLRFTLGTEFKINNYHRLDIYYHFHMNQAYDARYKGNNATPETQGNLKSWTNEKQNCHVIGIDYKFKL
jgi:hypothetical protein